MTRAHHVLPHRSPPLRPRNDVIEVELGTGELSSTVLTAVLIARVDVEPTEAHRTAGHAIVCQQQDDAGDPDGTVDEADRILLRRQVRPAVEIEGPILLVDRVRDALV